MVTQGFSMVVVGFIVGLSVYLVKDKLESHGDTTDEKIDLLNDKIDDLNKSFENIEIRIHETEKKNSRENDIIIKWLAELTKAVNNEKDVEVDVPDEVYTRSGLDLDENDIR